MSFNGLRELDTLYAQKPSQSTHPASSNSSGQVGSAFSFFDGLSNASSSSTSSSQFSVLQRPSSVCLPSQSSHRGGGGPTPMARTHSNSLLHNDSGSAFDDLMSLFDNGPSSIIKHNHTHPQAPVPVPINILKQQSPVGGRSSSPQHFLKRKSSVGASSKDPFAALSNASNYRSSFTPTSSSPQMNWSSFSGGASKSPIPSTPEAADDDDDFGDFTEAVKAPTMPTRSLQDGGRRSLSISTPSIPNIRGLSTSPKPPPMGFMSGNHGNNQTNNFIGSNNNLLNINFNGSGSLLNTPLTPPLLGSRTPTPEPPKSSQSHPSTTSPAKSPAADEDFGEFIATPISSSNSPIATIPSKPSLPPPHSSTSTSQQPNPTIIHNPSISNQLHHRKLSHPNPHFHLQKPAHPPLAPLSAILTPFPQLLLLPSTHLFQKLTKHPYPLRQRILSQPQTHTFLLGTCEIVRVLGRLIAGRKNRAARAGSVGGAAIMRHKQKEDREISELVRSWKEDGYARVKSALSRPSTTGGKLGVVVVPELETELTAEMDGGVGNVLEEEEGGCELCALRRGEVVRKLHEEREGKAWWIDGWGHRGCRNWWERWEGEVAKAWKN